MLDKLMAEVQRRLSQVEITQLEHDKLHEYAVLFALEDIADAARNISRNVELIRGRL